MRAIHLAQIQWLQRQQLGKPSLPPFRYNLASVREKGQLMAFSCWSTGVGNILKAASTFCLGREEQMPVLQQKEKSNLLRKERRRTGEQASLFLQLENSGPPFWEASMFYYRTMPSQVVLFCHCCCRLTSLILPWYQLNSWQIYRDTQVEMYLVVLAPLCLAGWESQCAPGRESDIRAEGVPWGTGNQTVQAVL